MTIKEYIATKFEAFNINEAMLTDIMATSGLDVEAVYDSEAAQPVGVALCGMVEELVFAPKLRNVSEGGFSLSWDLDGLGKYYLWLCRRYGVKPNKDTLAEMGLNVIVDRTSMW